MSRLAARAARAERVASVDDAEARFGVALDQSAVASDRMESSSADGDACASPARRDVRRRRPRRRRHRRARVRRRVGRRAAAASADEDDQCESTRARARARGRVEGNVNGR